MFYTPAVLNTAQVSNRFIFSDVNRTDSDLVGVSDWQDAAGCTRSPTPQNTHEALMSGILYLAPPLG